VFVHLRGHGSTPVPRDEQGRPVPGGYDDLAGELEAVVSQTRATRAVGVSLGAATIVRLLTRRPGVVDKVVLCLPPRFAEAGERGHDPLADALEARDASAVTAALRAGQPEAVRGRPAVTVWARRRAGELLAGDVAGLVAVLRRFGAAASPQDLAAVQALSAAQATGARTAVLVIAQEGDERHPVSVAQQWAAAFGRADARARLEVLPAGGVLWSDRDRLRALISTFLNE
jgi:pimeloyl-ACP methyl ester carboxylesterase